MKYLVMGTLTPPSKVGDAPGNRDPTIEAIQRDVALANTYRIELIKLLLALAGALFAFTVAFRPTLLRVDVAWAMAWGWVGLAVSMFGGIFHMMFWDHYYKSYRDHDWGDPTIDAVTRKAAGRAERKKVNGRRKIAMYAQFGGFIVGVAGVAFFAGVNIDNGPKTLPGASSTQAPAPSVSTGAQPTPPSGASMPTSIPATPRPATAGGHEGDK